MFNWFRRRGARPKPGRRAGPADHPGGRRDSHQPTELLDLRRGGDRGDPPRETLEPFAPAQPDYSPPAPSRPSPPSAPSFAPPRPNPTPSGGGFETVMIDTSQASQSGDVAAVMVGINGPLKNRVYPIFDQENHLGRTGKGGCFDKDDETISRDHGKLRFADGCFHIRPLSERLPIIVNGERLNEEGEMLRDGDTIQMGQSAFRFKVV